MKPIKIFLVDDDHIFVFLAKKTIETTNYATQIKEFGNGKNTIDYLKKIVHDIELLPDIIFLDLNMPVMDGWGFLEEYELLEPEIRKKIPLYLVSSSISPHDIARAKKFSIVSDFFSKSLVKEKLIELFNN